ncbi:MAG TPA: amidohydrolase family protein [Candidatus Binataceae bacterium]|nr:amidohydrolase family protein [Candidatus Binataceae bacterium]
MADFDLVIRDGMIIDGTRMPRFRGDIGVRNGRIAKIGRLRSSDGAKVIDASGMIVAPGVVDLHTHYDAQLFWDPSCSISSWHGVTSIVIGNCGFGFAPVHPEGRERAMLTMTRVEAIPYASMKAGMPWDWTTFPEFLDSIDRHPKTLNILPYVPVSPLLTYVMGLDNAKSRPPTEAEEREICRLLDEAMDAGACGWSAQRLDPNGPACVQRDFDGTPMVSDLMADETCLALARVLARRNEGFVQMTLVSTDPMHDMNHFEQLAQISGRPVLYNVVQPRDSRPMVHRQTIEWLESCRQRGIPVYGQAVTVDTGMAFTFIDWNLFDECQAWCDATTGTREERAQKLSDPSRREALRSKMPFVITDQFDQIFVSQVERAELKDKEGLTLRELSERTGKHPVDAMLDLAVADDLNAEFYAPGPNQNMDFMKEMLEYPYLIPGVSDGGAHTKFFTGGQYPTEFLANLVRERGMLPLEDAHWRLSALPAMCAGFRDRGTLREGAPADVIVYDLDKLAVGPMEKVYDLPGGEWRRIRRAKGYQAIVVNGEVTMSDGLATGATSGRLLRHGHGG